MRGMSNADPIAFFFTWSTYGTWLPGDARGWVEYRKGFQLPNPILELEAKARMTASACRLSSAERSAVQLQMHDTCQRRGWILYAVNCRSNHIHLVTSAHNAPKFMRAHLKGWCTRCLDEQQRLRGVSGASLRTEWWAERGSIRWLFDEVSLEAAIQYVLDQQDNTRRFISR